MNTTRSSRPILRRALATAMLATFAVLPGAPGRAAGPAIAPERNPPGDIPDDQVFVTYASPQGYSLKVPEGWARREGPAGVTFANVYGTVAVTVAQVGTSLDVATVKGTEVAALVAGGRAVKVLRVAAAALPAGRAVKVDYTSDSEPNPVTGRRVRLENERILVDGPGRRATMTLSAPAGADNVDQWNLIAGSFRWE